MLISISEKLFHKKEERTVEIFTNIRGRPSNILNMGSPIGKGRSIRWSLRKAFGEIEGVRIYKRLMRDIRRYRKLLFQERFYQAHAEKLILFRAGKVVAESDDLDNLVENFLPKAESSYYLICNVSRLTGHSFPSYHPVPWIYVEPNENLSVEEIEELLIENSKYHGRYFDGQKWHGILI